MAKLNLLLKKLWGRMAIFISNMLYIASVAPAPFVVRNKPLIGWNSFYDVSGVSSPHTVDGFPVSSVWSGDTYTKWRSSSAGPGAPESKYLIFEMADGDNIDYVGIAGHDMGTKGIGYFIQKSDDGSTWVDITDERIPDDNSAIVEFFDSTDSAYFRIVFVVPPLSEGVYVAHVKIGRMLQLERPRYVGDIPGGMDTQVEKIASKSYSGQHLGSVLISQGNKFIITQENNTPTFVRSSALQNFFSHAHLLRKLSNGPTETFFYAWRPDDYPLEVQYCGETTSFNAPANQRSNGMMQWSMSGDAYL